MNTEEMQVEIESLRDQLANTNVTLNKMIDTNDKLEKTLNEALRLLANGLDPETGASMLALANDIRDLRKQMFEI